jgi:hypothetical protein
MRKRHIAQLKAQHYAQHYAQPDARLTARPIARFLCCAVLALSTACQPHGSNAAFSNYLSKLSSDLTTTAPAVQPGIELTPPPATALQLDIPASPVDSLDLLLLSGCAVQANIAKRQTSLGRLAKPSQRLLLELEYLRLAPACISRLRTGNTGGNLVGNISGNNPVIADVLEAAWQEKRAQLPALIFNATLGGDEYRAFWLAIPAPGDYPRSSPAAVAAAMGAINDQTRRWLSGDYGAHNRNFELLLSEVAGGDGGARLQGWAHRIDWLAVADRMLAQAGEPRCSRRSRHAEGHRSIANYFIDTIEPLTAQSQQRYRMVAAPALALETQLGATLPTQYRDWIDNRNRHVAKLSGAPTRHLEQLNRLRQACTAE